MREADAVDQLEEQLHRAVKLRLVADVPVGTFMSGGIDLQQFQQQLHSTTQV